MDSMPYKLLVVDMENSAVLLTAGENGEILSEWSFPREYIPLDIKLSCNGQFAYIPAMSKEDRGILFSLDLVTGEFTRLPLDLPAIERFAVGPKPGQGILATRDGALFSLDITGRKLSLFGRSGTPTACVGLATDAEAVYTAWQHEGNGILAVFAPTGELIAERFLPGLPTNLAVSSHYVFIPFTAAEAGDEGLLTFEKRTLSDSQPNVITLHHCPDKATFRIYPCYVAITPDESTAYVVDEDSANISVIDMQEAAVSGYIPVGRSLSCLTLLPDSHFAVAGSNMFADLSLIDLVNRRLLSLTDSDRELFGQVAVIPAE